MRPLCRVARRRTVYRRGRVHRPGDVTCAYAYAVTSRPPARAGARALRGYLRAHRGSANKTHGVRDGTVDGDRSQPRTGAAPQVLAACRILALARRRRAGHPNRAAARRTSAGRPPDAVPSVLATASV